MWLYYKIKTLRGQIANDPNPKGDYAIWPVFWKWVVIFKIWKHFKQFNVNALTTGIGSSSFQMKWRVSISWSIVYFTNPTVYRWRGTLYIVRSEIFNLDHEIETLHFIWNGEDPCPLQRRLLVFFYFIFFNQLVILKVDWPTTTLWRLWCTIRIWALPSQCFFIQRKLFQQLKMFRWEYENFVYIFTLFPRS